MNHLVDIKIQNLLCLFVMLAIVCCASMPAMGQSSSGQNSLSSKNYAWFDAESNEVKRIELPQRPEAKSRDRAKINLRKTKPAQAPAAGPPPPAAVVSWLGAMVWTLIALVVAALIAILIWAFLRLEANEIDLNDSAPRRSMEESIKQLPFDLETNGETGDFRQQAQWNYQKDNFNKATILLFSHVLVSLDQVDHIRLRKGKTNRQYLGEISHLPPMSAYFSKLMVLFETTFFGDHDISKTEFESAWNELDNFQANLRNTPHPLAMALEVANA